MEILAFYQFIPMLLLENNVYYNDIITPLKIQGARYLANELVSGAGLLFSLTIITVPPLYALCVK